MLGTRKESCCVPCCLLFLLLPAPAFAITETQFVERVLAQDQLLEEAQIGLDIKQIELDSSRDNYQNWKASLSAELDYRYQDLGRHTNSNYAYTKKAQHYPQKIELRFEKRFLSNPGSLQIGVSRRRDRTSEVRYKKYQHNSDHDLGGGETGQYIVFNYPLLKHDSNAASLKTYHRNILDLKRQKLLFYEIKEDFLSDRLTDYLSWVLYQQQVSINQEFLNKLQHLQPKDEQETALLKSVVYQIENHNLDTQSRLQAIKQKLSVLLADQTILTEIAEFDLHRRIQLIEQALPDYLQAHNRTLHRISLDSELKQIDIAYYKNQNLPILDVTAKLESNQSNRNSRTSTYDDDTMHYAVGLEFNYPLGGNIAHQANLRKSLLGVRKLEISYQDKQQDIVADIQLLAALLTLDEDRLLDAIDAAAQSSRIEYENYQLGQTSLRNLLQAYKDERVAKLAHIDIVAAYQMNSIKYNNLADRTILSCRGHLSACDF